MTVKEYNEWRKELGRVQVLLYAFPNADLLFFCSTS